MTKWNDKKNMNLSFKAEPNEEAKAFFERMQKELTEREEAFKKRIKQLFDEEIEVGGDKADEAYKQILQVFATGYQHGWNDLYSLFSKRWKPSDEQMLALEGTITMQPQSSSMTSALIELYKQLKKLREE